MLQILLLWLDSYHWFSLLLIKFFSCFNFLHHTNTEQHGSHYYAYRVRALNGRTIRGSSWLLRAKLVFCWKYTGTLVTKFSLACYPFRILMITSPRYLAFTETWSKTSHQKVPVFLLSLISLSWMVQRKC